ncbi:MAG: hypothetical protein J6N78_04175 [Clostridia bacterium]|nr:hypothetical protein [Clostridia bacterium]
MNRKIIPDKCICGNDAKVVGYYIKGSANHKNFFVKCEKCKTRTRSRKIPYKAIEEWNEYKGDLFLKERGL